MAGDQTGAASFEAVRVSRAAAKEALRKIQVSSANACSSCPYTAEEDAGVGSSPRVLSSERAGRSLPLPLLNTRLLTPGFCCSSGLLLPRQAQGAGPGISCFEEKRDPAWMAEGATAFARLLTREELPPADGNVFFEDTRAELGFLNEDADEDGHPMGSWQYVLDDGNFASFVQRCKEKTFSAIFESVRRVEQGRAEAGDCAELFPSETESFADARPSDRPKAEDVASELIAMADFYLSLLYLAGVLLQKQRVSLQLSREQIHANSQELWQCLKARQAAVEQLSEDLVQAHEQVNLFEAEAAQQRQRAVAAAEELAQARATLSQVKRQSVVKSSLRQIEELNKLLDATTAERDKYAEQLKQLANNKGHAREARDEVAPSCCCLNSASRGLAERPVGLSTAEACFSRHSSRSSCLVPPFSWEFQEGEEEKKDLKRPPALQQRLPTKGDCSSPVASASFLTAKMESHFNSVAEAATAESSGASSAASSSLHSSQVSPSHAEVSFSSDPSASLQAELDAAEALPGFSDHQGHAPQTETEREVETEREREIEMKIQRETGEEVAYSLEVSATLQTDSPEQTVFNNICTEALQKTSQPSERKALKGSVHLLIALLFVVAAILAVILIVILKTPQRLFEFHSKVLPFDSLSQPLKQAWLTLSNVCAAAAAEEENKLRMQIEAFAWAATGS